MTVEAFPDVDDALKFTSKSLQLYRNVRRQAISVAASISTYYVITKPPQVPMVRQARAVKTFKSGGGVGALNVQEVAESYASKQERCKFANKRRKREALRGFSHRGAVGLVR
jgi:hypothetical protein